MLANLATSGIESLTFFETIGWRGVMETSPSSPQPDRFPSFHGGVFPMWHVFASLNGYLSVSAASISEPHRVAAFAVSDQAGRKRIVLANLTPVPVVVSLAPAHGAVRLLEESNLADAMKKPEAWWSSSAAPLNGAISLPAYAVAFVD